jgi:PAS domain S-box-containing protein
MWLGLGKTGVARLTDSREQWAALGQLGGRIASHNWAATSLGPIESWSISLKTLVGLMLASRQPMFIAWGPDQNWFYNDAFIPIAGRKHPECLGRPSSEVWAEAWTDLKPLFDLVRAGEPVHMDDISLELDRRGKLDEAHFSFSYTPAREVDGSVAGLFGVCVETTDQIIANRVLASEQLRFARLFEQAPTFMAMLRGPEHVIELANPRYLELVGHRPVLGHTVADALPEAAGQGFVDLLDNVYRSGEAYSAFGFKYAMQAIPGGPIDERFLDFVYQPITDAQGAVVGIFVQGVDVTERKLMEIALQAANENLEQRVAERTAELQNFRTFYVHSSECHATLSLRDDGVFEYDEVNPATLRLYKMSRDDVIGRTVDEIFEPTAAAELKTHLAAALRQNSPYSYSRRQGTSTVEAVVTPIPAEPGQRPHLAVTARDITERQNLEEQLRQAQKMEAVGQLTGGLAHDFNNLLQGITGALDRVQHRVAAGRTDDIDRFLKAAAESANRAAALTHRLLAFSRRQTLDPKPTDVNRLIGGMEDLISRTMGPAVSVNVIGAAGLWPVRVDPSQLESSLLNLCINARDAMPDGGKLIVETSNKWMDARAARERDLLPGQYVSLCVTDNGSGMEPHVIEHAFDPFFTTKPLGQGTGLGLSMIYGFVRQSGGQVRVYSEVGKGTTICLYFPRYAGTAEQAKPDVPTEKVEAGAGEVVLVVDDEATVRMLVAEVLGDAGYEIVEAADGPAALKILQSGRRLDLLITDVGLPGGMNGRQVADAARVQRKDLKILFITGFAENAVVGNGYLDAGMEILAKPFAMSTLANRVREMIDAVA